MARIFSYEAESEKEVGKEAEEEICSNIEDYIIVKIE